MEVPDGDQDVTSTKSICKVLKTLYGWKEAPWRGNVIIDLLLNGIGFESSPADPAPTSKRVVVMQTW